MGRSSKDKRDIFYRLAKEEGWRARSAFKLLQINSQFEILSGVTKAVDLCAAPGSWSQVLSQSLFGKPDAKIVAVDLQSMAPIPGVITLQGDITSESTATEIIRLLGQSAELVVCDGAPDVTGLHHLDEYLQGQLLLSALNIATCVLGENGTFVAKMFRSSKSGVETIFSKVSLFFQDVVIAKPRSSRASSIESFIVARKFKLPPEYEPKLGDPMMRYSSLSSESLSGAQNLIIPFITCGDLNGYDADTTYTLPPDYQYRSPVQSPINPPYEEAISRAKGNVNTSRKEAVVVMEVKVEFSGGAELHVGGIREQTMKVDKDTSMKEFLKIMETTLIKDRPELLLKDGDVRPGILVLINDIDWELMDKLDYALQPSDKITFISTLHGG